MSLLTLPLVKHIVTDDKTKSGENRVLAQKPTLPKTYSDVGQFITFFDDYLEDQFGFRKNFISGANKTRYWLFNEITSKQITVGKNKFIFFNSHSAKYPNSMIKSVCGITRGSDKHINHTVDSVSRFIKYTQQFGISVNLSVIPTKSRIYPENLPRLERNWCLSKKTTWRDRLIQKLNSVHPVYYPLKKMIALKEHIQVYLPSYFHYKGELPYTLAKSLMKELWNISPDFVVKPTKKTTQSDLRTYFKGLHFYNDTVIYDFKKHGVKSCSGKRCLIGLNKYYKKGVSHTYINPKNSNQLSLVILSDSFGPPIAKYFSMGFRKVICINIFNLEENEKKNFYQWILTTVQPTHLLYLIHDGGTFGLVKSIDNLLD